MPARSPFRGRWLRLRPPGHQCSAGPRGTRRPAALSAACMGGPGAKRAETCFRKAVGALLSDHWSRPTFARKHLPGLTTASHRGSAAPVTSLANVRARAPRRPEPCSSVDALLLQSQTGAAPDGALSALATAALAAGARASRTRRCDEQTATYGRRAGSGTRGHALGRSREASYAACSSTRVRRPCRDSRGGTI
jgi:hypothetical protein